MSPMTKDTISRNGIRMERVATPLRSTAVSPAANSAVSVRWRPQPTALRAGADGFLLKRARPAEIVHAVRLVAEGESLLFPVSVRQLATRYGGNHAPRAPLSETGLTEREAEVLRLMARGLSNAEIAARLIVGTETVKSHVSAVLAKLGARDRTQAVIAAYESGFVAPG
ncbi:LuxR C-terminal-related transcriptional regulator [Streptomyces sp. NPDC007905]|uniref:response regulator transcription factor n=1 Tax=Streptomyces sp. NPDC007905 TaxID=3364788 RepID=UPI0036E228EE